MSPRFTEVAVQTPVRRRFHYRVPDHLAARACVGARVLVSFGGKKLTGVVVRDDTSPPEGVEPVELADVLADEPLPPDLVELCMWMAEYYEAPPGEAMRAALPVGRSVEAHEIMELTDAGLAAAAGDRGAMPARPSELLATLARGPRPTTGMSAPTRAALATLEQLGLARRGEQRERARVRLRQERIARLAPELDFVAARRALARAPKQLAVLEALADGEQPTLRLGSRIGGAAEALRELAERGYVLVEAREAALTAVEVDPAMAGAQTDQPPPLTAEQTAAVAAIAASVVATAAANPDGAPRPFTPFLLHGVTGSGKTEVYLRVIAETLAAGKTAIVLVPEISLTPQLAARFRSRFGDRVAILHSGLSERQRLAEWSRLRRGEAVIAVGARSAVFAPVANIGVIVVDEEHDPSFKQDEGVKYHGRDVALVRAQRAGAVCVLGSATPSLESYAHAERGAYRLLVLTERPSGRPMPPVEIIDLKTDVPDRDSMLSAPLRAAIIETLAAGDQAILFLNRRGFSTFVMCIACGAPLRCPNCAVSLTYHRFRDRLACHYCDYSSAVPMICPRPECRRSGTIARKGIGTEKIADAVAKEFTSARVGRLDRDVASGSRVEVVLAKFARRELDILVGTQMVTKGHDFPGVTLVGVMCADTSLHVPDFRSGERTFQLLAQVAGRAGRGERAGRVIVQTYMPTFPAIVAAAAHDYPRFFAAESAERELLTYPPAARVILVRIDGTDAAEVKRAAEAIHRALAAAAGGAHTDVIVNDAGEAPLKMLRKRARWQIWLRSRDRQALRRVARVALAVDVPSKVRVALDVDPISSM